MNYHVEHLATFSTLMPTQQQITPKVALQRLFAMEKTSGIWTQKMTIQIEGSNMLIYDRESNDIVEDFPVANIHQPIAFSHSNHIYDNVLTFTVKHPKESEGELHIFQCVSDHAQKIAEDLNNWMSKHGNNQISSNSDTQNSKFSKQQNAQSAIKVKDAVNIFNAIAVQREKKPTNPHLNSRNEQSSPIQNHRDQDVRSVTTNSSVESRDQLRNNSGNDSATSLNSNTTSNHSLSNANNETNLITSQRNYEQPLSIDMYVNILNHCFDEIERFSLRLQHAAAAFKELQMRNFRKKEKGNLNGGEGLVQLRARGPSEEDYFEILSMFKLSFNLLAKLKGYIHDPNAPELVHFLFTPLAIIIEAAKNNLNIPIDPTAVEIPFLHHEAIDLLSNCCTSKEFDLWQSLGPNWTQSKSVRHVNTPKFPIYQPKFSDGWAPLITEPELIGFTPTPEQLEHHQKHFNSRSKKLGAVNSDSDEREDQLEGNHHFHYSRNSPVFESIELEQKNWLIELQNRNARILRVLYPRTANNEKELTVYRGEILELQDNSRKWWKAVNSRNKTGFLPNTICKIINDFNPDFNPDLSTNEQRNELNNHNNLIRMERQGKRGEFRYF